MTNHAGDDLSALIDGELDPEQERVVRDHLATCEECSTELESVRFGRAMVRRLPAIDPPRWFLDDIIPIIGSDRRDRTGLRYVVPQVVIAIAIVAAVVAGYEVRSDGTAPEVSAAVARHAATAEAMAAGTGQSFDDLVVGTVTASTAPPRSTAGMSKPYTAPSRMAGYRLAGGFETEGGVQLLYERGDHRLSMFEEPGKVDWAALPSPGHRFTIDGHQAWRWDRDGAGDRVIVVQSDGLIVTLVGDVGEDVLEAARALPSEPGPGVVDRVEQATTDALSQLGAAP
jgi:anti-sigma factor RsiW